MFRTLALAGTLIATTPFVAIAQEQPTQSEYQADLEAFLSRPDIKRRMVSADNGDPYSMVWLSDKIEQELGENFIEKKAILPFQLKYLMAAVAKGYGPAFKRMGDMVKYGRTPEGGPMDALGFYEGGAKAGDFDAAYEFYKMALDIRVCSACSPSKYGDGTDLRVTYTAEEQKVKDTKTLFDPDYRAAENSAKQRAVQSYANEKGAMVRRAIEYLDTPAMQDNWNAQSLVARSYLYGTKGANVERLMFGFFEPSDGPSFLKPDPPKARPIFERFAAMGNNRAINWLSKLHLTGQIEGFEQNRDLFLKYTGQLAAQGNAGAAHLVGNIMLSGKPFGTDYDIAATYLYQAYEAGHAEAAGDLGYMFLSGSGVPKDDATALRLFTEGANRGSSKSADMVSQMYRDGVGVPPNGLLAKAYAKKAEDNRVAEDKAKALVDQIGL